MMSREEWLDYFETVNGRKPSEAELAQALAAGEFVDVLDAQATPSQTPQKPEHQVAQPMPTPESLQGDSKPHPEQPIPPVVSAEFPNQMLSAQPVNPQPQATPAAQPLQPTAAGPGPVASQATQAQPGFSPAAAPFGQVQPGFTGAVPSYVMPVPKRRKKVGLIVGIIVGVLILIGLSVGGYIGYRYVTGAVPEGTYASSKLDASISDAVDNLNDDILTDGMVSDTKLEMSVSDDNTVKITMSYKIDWDTYWQNGLNEIKESYKSSLSDTSISDSVIDAYVESTYGSYESSYKSEFNSNLSSAVKSAGGMYDKDSGEITFSILTGEINQLNHTITVTAINDDFLDTKEDDDYSYDFLSTVIADKVNDSFDSISEGQEIDYTVSGSSLSFGGMTFQK